MSDLNLAPSQAELAGWLGAIALVLLVVQIPALALLLTRLLSAARRASPLRPQNATPAMLGTVSVIIPTLNEAHRLQPCLDGLTRQGYELREAIVVDSHSQDGTVDLVKAAAQRDPRFRVVYDDPLPADWVGRPWALHTGFLHSSPQSDWVLGIDADTQPQPGLIPALLHAAQEQGYDLITLAPQFILKQPGEWWLQPALLMTLIYRFGAAGSPADGPERTMANGQCCLIRRSLLESLDGYTSARQSFCDDVTLVREAARRGAKVGFLDGSSVLKVRMYEGIGETWREWGRSLDLKDASTPAQTWSDVAFLLVVQALPWLLVPTVLTILAIRPTAASPTFLALLALNLCLLLLRLGTQFGIRTAYDRPGSRFPLAFWLSPLADPLAALRILRSASRKPTQWRGRRYE
ncbi:2'-O-glycosyltransferase CruG [Leptolyngbya sp. O-77]|uniref:2'-O-glycosyltransferase CruG n=1 Tax=Leptolyngbya sp. O-77 TaxID=1080068 RepID=UPI00074D4BAB|nr:glycosyltransferase family 2 protein [Leptolyngbya sp. O-77]BAU41516.1 Undecaprenyl-phosphate 4-deoxy-4-formamido-L-arabinose transferase [Leptolyngbya sp. O-77]